MEQVLKAITAKFNALPENTLHSAVSGRMYLVDAPQGATLPYIVYFIVTDTPDYNFSSVFDQLQVQFSLFSTADEHTEILNMHQYLKDLYDDCTLTVTGYDFEKMERTLDLGMIKDPDHEVFHYPVQYDIWLRKSLS